MPAQVVDTLPDEVWANPATIWIGTSPIGVTKGGVGWDPEKEYGIIEFDGRRANIKGQYRINRYGGKLTFTIIQLGGTGQLDRLEPGSTSASGTPPVTTVITPKKAGEFFAAADYLNDVRAIWDGAGVFWALRLPCAFVNKYTINAGADDQTEVSVELIACIDLATQSANDAPYVYEKRTAEPA